VRVSAALAGVATLGLLLVATPPARADDVGDAQARANAAARAESQAESDAAQLETQVAELERRVGATQQELDTLAGSVRTVAVARYMHEASGPQLLAGPDLNTQVAADALGRYLSNGDEAAVDRYRALSQDLASQQAALQTQLENQRAAVAALAARRRQLQAELSRLVELQRQREAAAAAAARAAAAHAASAAAAPHPRGGGGVTGVIATGAFVCPVQGPHSFSDDFGAPRSGGRSHQGNDIFAPRGTPVVAPVTGTVVDRSNSLGGLAVHITGDDGNFYYGAHLSGYAATGHLAAGTVIGYVGNTGDAAGGPTHLHFEIHPHGGAAVDPYPTLVKYC
jgi:murein DD-endopeptidase MepM/ murein hydrolase activator NlpD